MAEPGTVVDFDTYFELEQASKEKNELINGSVVAMTGASATHADIATGLTVALYGRTRCKVRQSDFKVVVQSEADFNCYYPDVVVQCHASDHYFTSNPALVAEVLSKSTENMDRVTKLKDYLSIEGLAYYLVLSQISKRVEVYSKQDEMINFKVYGEGEVVDLGDLTIEIPVNEIYQRCDIPE